MNLMTSLPAFVLAALLSPLLAADYYIDPAGNDGSGTISGTWTDIGDQGSNEKAPGILATPSH